MDSRNGEEYEEKNEMIKFHVCYYTGVLAKVVFIVLGKIISSMLVFIYKLSRIALASSAIFSSSSMPSSSLPEYACPCFFNKSLLSAMQLLIS